ncbi:MAG: exopolysaccharide biosynthesis protein [Chloroflexota bacterium]|nr:exopolysaccharide biosynthesis protein [Chloroflexota bacterium]
MTTKFSDPDVALDVALRRAADSMKAESITIGALLELVGEQGLLVICIILSIPFLFPVSIPGVSAVFGAVIILIGVGVTLDRLPWLPRQIVSRELKREQLLPVFEKGIEFVKRLERFVRPRLSGLTEGALMNRVNGIALVIAGLMLIIPLGLVPFSNTIPAIAIVLLCIGMLQRDGYAVLGGYLFIILTLVYFGGLALGLGALIGVGADALQLGG